MAAPSYVKWVLSWLWSLHGVWPTHASQPLYNSTRALMPCYIFKCFEHDKTEMKWLSVADRKKSPTCPVCLTPMERDYHSEHVRHVPASAFPYVTKNLDPSGKPIEVRSEAHLQSLCKQFGVRPRPDVAYEEDRSYTDANGQWRIKEGNGRGMPGSWI